MKPKTINIITINNIIKKTKTMKITSKTIIIENQFIFTIETDFFARMRV